MRNIRVDIQYDGSDFSGWQIQQNAVTIQGHIQDAVKSITAQETTLYGAGRTDAGVHALNQVANFKTDHNLDARRFKDAINFYLPQTIRITQSREVPKDFHARKSAQWRLYRYILGKSISALYYRHRWETTQTLNISRMNEISAYLLGWHDFRAFCTVSSQLENNECHILSANWREDSDNYIFEIKANRFLHSMVRSLVGLMVEIGNPNESLTLNSFIDIMDAGDHTRLKHVAPARGLYLVEVGY